jgi:hypothetical protein
MDDAHVARRGHDDVTLKQNLALPQKISPEEGRDFAT